MKKKPSTAKLLSGEIIIGLNTSKSNKAKSSGKYADGKLFSSVANKLHKAIPLMFPDGGLKSGDTVEGGNPNAGAKGHFLEGSSTVVVNPDAVVQYNGDDPNKGVVLSTIDPNATHPKVDDEGNITYVKNKYVNEGNVVTKANLRNNIDVNFTGTIGEKKKMLKKLNRSNWAGSHGFRGRDWDAHMTEEEKAKFKEENPFFERGRKRELSYYLDGINSKKFVNYTHNKMADGGSINNSPDGEPDKPASEDNSTIKTYEGSDNYNDYLKWQSQNKVYTDYNTEHNKVKEAFGEGKPLNTEQSNAQIKKMGFGSLPENATGLIEYDIKDKDYTASSTIQNYYTSGNDGKLYLPVYANPGDNKYEVVDSPEVKAKKQEQSDYIEKNKDIQGWVRNTYYDPSSGTNKTELVPLPNGQPIPTNGTFVPKATFEEGGEMGKVNNSDYYKALGGVLRDTFKHKTFLAEGGKMPIEELLTGESVEGVNENNTLTPNSETEDREYIKFPDETTQRGYGEKHSKGGMDMHLPDGSKILSDKRKLTREQAKKLNEDFDIKVSHKDTYAKAIDKYVKKIGLSKLYKDQEEVISELEKVINSDGTEGTNRINKEYLSKKINQIEKQKKDKETLKSKLFDKVFTMQEVGKRLEEDKNIGQFFKEGGISRDSFKKVVNRYGLSEREGIDLYKGKMPNRLMDGGNVKYAEGGEHVEPKTVEEAQDMYKKGLITRQQADAYEVKLSGSNTSPATKFTTTTGEHQFSDQEKYAREKQSSSGGAFGKITKENLPQVLNALYQNFPDIVAEEYGVKYNDDGTIEFDKNINFSKVSDKVENFQKRAQKRMQDTANLVLSNPDSFSPEYVAGAQDYLDNETFNGSLARGIDAKQGQFTSGRFSLGIDVVTPEENDALKAKGIFTTKQLQQAVDAGEVDLSQTSLDRLDNIRTLTPEGTDPDFALNSIETVKDAPKVEDTAPAIEKQTVDAPNPLSGIVDNVSLPKPNSPKQFNFPDQTPLPPSAMGAHAMGNIRLERIDPVRIGVETELQQTSDAIKQGTQALEHLPPNQRAAAIVGMQANAQKGINEAIHKANIVNAQNQASAELFNIGQSGKEEQARVGNLLNFEQRQLTAKAKTEEEVRNYYDQLQRINVNNFRNNQDLNLVDQLSPDYSLNSNGTSVEYSPEGDFKLKDRSNLKGLF